jgi:helix-turn-helix protein
MPNSGPLPLAAAQERLGKPGRPRKAALADQAVAAVSAGGPRLLGVRATAGYLGIGQRMVHELRASGRLRPVRLPLAGDREVRKLLFDRADLDRLIEASKEPSR